MLGSNDRIKLINHLQRTLIEEHQLSPKQSRDIARYVVYSVFVVIGGSAGFPILSAGRKFAKDNDDLAGLYTYGFLVSLGALNIWGLFDYIKYMDIKSSINPQTSAIKRRTQAVVSACLAMLTAVANVPVNYHYDQNVLLTGQGFICDSILLSCTYQRIITSKRVRLLRASPYQKKAYQITELLNIQMDIGIQILINLPPHERDGFLERMKFSQSEDENDQKVLFDDASPNRIIGNLLNLAKPIVTINERHEFWYNGPPRQFLLKVVSPTLPFLWAYVNFRATLSGFDELIGNSPFKWILTPLPVALAYVLEFILTKETLTVIYDTIVQMCIGTFMPELGFLLFPYKHSLAKLWGMFTVAFAFSTRAQITEDSIPDPYSQAFVPMMIAITLLFKSASMQSLINTGTHALIRRFGSQSARDISLFVHSIDKFQLSIEVASREQVAEFVNDLDQQVRENIDASSKLAGTFLELETLAAVTEAPEAQEDSKLSQGRAPLYAPNMRPTIFGQTALANRSQSGSDLDEEHKNLIDETPEERPTGRRFTSVCKNCVIL